MLPDYTNHLSPGVGVGTWVPCFCCTGLVLLVSLGTIVITPRPPGYIGQVKGTGQASVALVNGDKRSGALKASNKIQPGSMGSLQRL